MATPIRMPDLGTTVEEVTLITWLKKEGEAVKRGEALAEVETDKAAIELESAAEGVLLRQMVPAGSKIQPGTVIAYVGLAGESIPDESAKPAGPRRCKEPKRQVAKKSQVSILIRNLAEDLGVDLASVTGTGTRGQITREDVMRAKEALASFAGEANVEPCHTKATLPREQLGVANRVLRSIHEIPAVDLSCTLDMSATMNLRRKVQAESGEKVNYDAIFIYAVSRVIGKFPKFLSHVEGDKIIEHASVDISLAIGVGDRLYTPVVRSADKLSLLEIQRKVQQFADAADKAQLSVRDMAGGSLTISNLGMYPIQSFKMIIPPDQTAALSIGAIEQMAVVELGAIVCHPMSTVVLSVDHRRINGREAAEFVKELKEFMETL